MTVLFAVVVVSRELLKVSSILRVHKLRSHTRGQIKKYISARVHPQSAVGDRA